MKLACVLLFAAACVLLYFSSGMLLFVPGSRGESYFAAGRIVYGVLPTLASAALVGWLWARSSGSGNLGRSLKLTYLLASAVVALFWFGLMASLSPLKSLTSFLGVLVRSQGRILGAISWLYPV